MRTASVIPSREAARAVGRLHAGRSRRAAYAGITVCVASFSRALLEGLSANQTDAAFNTMLDASIQRIYEHQTPKSRCVILGLFIP